MAIHCSILAWKILWTEESGRLWSMGSQRVRHHGPQTHMMLNICSRGYLICISSSLKSLNAFYPLFNWIVFFLLLSFECYLLRFTEHGPAH